MVPRVRKTLDDALDENGNIVQSRLVEWTYGKKGDEIRDLNMSLNDKWVAVNQIDAFKSWMLYKNVGTVVFCNEKKIMALTCALIAQSQRVIGDLPNPIIPYSHEPKWLGLLPTAHNRSNNTSVATEARNALKVSQYFSPTIEYESQEELNDIANENFFGDPEAISMTDSTERLKNLVDNFRKVLNSYLASPRKDMEAQVITCFKHACDQTPGFMDFFPGRNLPLFEQFELHHQHLRVMQREMHVVQDRVDSRRDLRKLFSDIASFLNIEISWERKKSVSERDPRDIIETKLRLFPKVYSRSLSLFRYNQADMYIFAASLIESFDVKYAILQSTQGGTNITANQIREKRIESLSKVTNTYLEMVLKVLQLSKPLQVLRIILPDEHKWLLNDLESKLENLKQSWKHREKKKGNSNRNSSSGATSVSSTPNSRRRSSAASSLFSAGENNETGEKTLELPEDTFQNEGSIEGCNDDVGAKLLPEGEGQFSVAYAVYKLKLISDVCEFTIRENLERETAFMVSSNDMFAKLTGMDVSHLAATEMQTKLQSLGNELASKLNQLQYRNDFTRLTIQNYLSQDLNLTEIVGLTEESQNAFDSLLVTNFPAYFTHIQQTIYFQPYCYLRHQIKQTDEEIRITLFQQSLCRRLHMFVLKETNILETEPVPNPSGIPSLNPEIIFGLISQLKHLNNTSAQYDSSAQNEGDISNENANNNVVSEEVPPTDMIFPVDSQAGDQQVPNTIANDTVNFPVQVPNQIQLPQPPPLPPNFGHNAIQPNDAYNTHTQYWIENPNQPEEQPSVPDEGNEINPNIVGSAIEQVENNTPTPIPVEQPPESGANYGIRFDNGIDSNGGNNETEGNRETRSFPFPSIIPPVATHQILPSEGTNEIHHNVVNTAPMPIQPPGNTNDGQVRQEEHNNTAAWNPGPFESTITGNENTNNQFGVEDGDEPPIPASDPFNSNPIANYGIDWPSVPENSQNFNETNAADEDWYRSLFNTDPGNEASAPPEEDRNNPETTTNPGPIPAQPPSNDTNEDTEMTEEEVVRQPAPEQTEQLPPNISGASSQERTRQPSAIVRRSYRIRGGITRPNHGGSSSSHRHRRKGG